jgi:hypothetical protein
LPLYRVRVGYALFVLSQKVPIGNVKDAEAWVRSNLPRVILTPEGRDELIQEGLRILAEMWNRYEPGRGGHDPTKSSFSAYATKYFPGKLLDAWHRQEGHTLTTKPDGGREWRYPGKEASLDRIAEDHPEGLDSIRTLRHEDVYHSDLGVSVGAAIDQMYGAMKEQTIKVAILMADGQTPGRIAEALNVGPVDVEMSLGWIKLAIPYMSTLEAA